MRIDLQLSDPMARSGIVIAVTGLHAKAGVSTVALSLAQSFAKSRIRTVVVDADLVERGLSRTLGLAHEPGFTEALGQKCLNGEVHGTSQKYLSAIPAGMTSDFTDENLARGPLTRFLDQLRSAHDVSILDVGSFDERLVARLAAVLSDQSLLVVPADCDALKAESMASALSRLAPQRVHFVFNFARIGDPGLLPPPVHASLAG
jgi:Mrp family chromosome partitioning ATPase